VLHANFVDRNQVTVQGLFARSLSVHHVVSVTCPCTFYFSCFHFTCHIFWRRFTTCKARSLFREHVLVTAAAGAAGLAAVDVASNVMQAKVIGAAGSDDKCSLIKSYGAVDAINYRWCNRYSRCSNWLLCYSVDVHLPPICCIESIVEKSINWPCPTE